MEIGIKMQGFMSLFLYSAYEFTSTQGIFPEELFFIVSTLLLEKLSQFNPFKEINT